MNDHISSLLSQAREILAPHELPALEARILLSKVLQCSGEWVLSHPKHRTGTKAAQHFLRLVSKREKGIPIAYLLGFREFWGRNFELQPPVFIPRPDTETLMEALKNSVPSGAFTLHDLCTGSGCIAISAALEFPQARVSASDISTPALQIAKKNNIRFGSPVHNIIKSNFFSHIRGSFHVITANPPYLSRTEWKNFKKTGEDRRALYRYKEGITVYTHITAEASKHLEKGSLLLYEVGWTQADAVASIMERAAFTGIEIIKDLAGRKRVVKGIFHP